jgi:hypothetical protein
MSEIFTILDKTESFASKDCFEGFNKVISGSSTGLTTRTWRFRSGIDGLFIKPTLTCLTAGNVVCLSDETECVIERYF